MAGRQILAGMMPSVRVRESTYDLTWWCVRELRTVYSRVFNFLRQNFSAIGHIHAVAKLEGKHRGGGWICQIRSIDQAICTQVP